MHGETKAEIEGAAQKLSILGEQEMADQTILIMRHAEKPEPGEKSERGEAPDEKPVAPKHE